MRYSSLFLRRHAYTWRVLILCSLSTLAVTYITHFSHWPPSAILAGGTFNRLSLPQFGRYLLAWQSAGQQRTTKSRAVKPLKDRKFLVRDYSLWLGWNNVRYIIETALTLARLLDRELVLPAYTYASVCLLDQQLCQELAPLFELGSSVDLSAVGDKLKYPDAEESQSLVMAPLLQWKGWVVPIESMMDVSHMVSTCENVISFHDFLNLTQYHDPSSIGMYDGKWSTRYHGGMSYRSIEPEFFTETNKTIVDCLPEKLKPLLRATTPFAHRAKPSPLERECQKTLDRIEASGFQSNIEGDQNSPMWDATLIQSDMMSPQLARKGSPILERCLSSHGFRSVYGFSKAAAWMKAPYGAEKFIKREENLKGIKEELGNYEEQILHLKGEFHNGRPPASMLWSTAEGREVYANLVRTTVEAPEIYHKIARKLEVRMKARCQGRSWMGTHLRRGDFLEFNWVPEDISEHWNQIVEDFEAAVNLLNHDPKLLLPAHREFGTSLVPPRKGDPVYVATDVSGNDEYHFLRSANVVMLEDLLEESDRLEMGQLLSGMKDTLSILEQCLLMRSAFYRGDAHSSVEGLIVDRRYHHGIDEHLTLIKYSRLPE